MKFDDIISEAESNYEPTAYINWLHDLKENYEPDVYMTSEEKKVINSYISLGLEEFDHPFTKFMEDIEGQYRSVAFGLSENVLFGSLSEKELMQAWLRPSSIKVKE